MRTKNQIDFLRLLNENLAQNPMFVKLFEKAGEIIDKQIGEPLMQLDRIRSSSHIKRGDYLKVETEDESDPIKIGKVAHVEHFVDEDEGPLANITMGLGNGQSLTYTRRALHDRRILIDSSKLAGFDYYSDFISDADYARIVDYVSSYWSHGSSESPEFIKFLGFIKNMHLEMTQLWTIDKGDNAQSDDAEISKYDLLEARDATMTPVWVEGGKHYPTSHVEIIYDASISQNIDADIIHLFYLLAPIHLVFERVAGYIDAEIPYTIRIAGDLSFYNAGFVEIG